MSEWKEYRLGDIGTIIGGATPSTKVSENYGGEIPWITPNDLSNHNDRFISRGERNISDIGLNSCSAQMMPKNTVLFSSRAPIGYVAIAFNPLCTNQGFKSVVPNDKIVYSLFLYYLLKYYTPSIKELGSGTTFPEVSANVMRNVIVNLPPLGEQKKIAAILSALDDKIETNRRINRRLEELAQALFKSWFINFEPFGGKMPEDWKITTLDKIGDIIGGATPSKEHPEYYSKSGNGIAWLTPKDLSETKAKFTSRGSEDLTALGYSKCSAKLMPKGSILFSSRAPIGYVSIALNEICTNQGFKSFVPQKVGTAFAYYLLKYLTPEIENKSTGSTFKEASGSLMKSLQVFLPTSNILNKFEEICEPIFARQKDCESESTRLAALRDTLLPKLMSGELKVTTGG